jgi:hypothetical protein
MGIEELLTAPRSPWQNPYVERLIGSIRRGCLNQFVILNTKHLKRALASFSVTTMVSGPMWGWTSNIHSLGRSRVSGGSSAPIIIRCIDSIDGKPIFESLKWRKSRPPYVPLAHPFVERLTGTTRREYLDRILFWGTADLEAKLLEFQH